MHTSTEHTLCGICKKDIYKNCSCIACESCQQWVHATCNNLKNVRKIDFKTFICIVCMNKKERKEPKKIKQMETDEELPADRNIKVESGSDGEYEEFEGYENHSEKLSEFELTRLQNIKKNEEMFEEYNIREAKESLAPKRRKKERKLEMKKEELEPVRRRKSLRIQNIEAEAVDVNTHGKFRYRPDLSDDRHVRKPSEMDMKCANIVKEGSFDTTVKTLLDDMKLNTDNISDMSSYSEDIVKYKEKISSLVVTDIAKLSKVPAYSMAWYPSHSKKLVCMGDQKGSIGVFDVDHSSEEDSSFLFNVHAEQPVNCLTFSPTDPSKIYSSCYDGTLTCGDFNQLTFTQQYATNNDKIQLRHFTWSKCKQNTLLISTTAGEIIRLDLSSGKAEKILTLNIGRKVSAQCVDCHPLNEYLIATSSSDGTLATWDLRSTGKNENKCLSSFKAAKTTLKAFFSPVTGNKLLLTSQDHRLRVFDVKKTGIFATRPRHSIKHTTLRAAWDPKRDDSFVCGSMAVVRRLDMFGCDEKTKKLLSYTLHSEHLTDISSVNVFHPQLNLLASCNAYGKLLIWSLPR